MVPRRAGAPCSGQRHRDVGRHRGRAHLGLGGARAVAIRWPPDVGTVAADPGPGRPTSPVCPWPPTSKCPKWFCMPRRSDPGERPTGRCRQCDSPTLVEPEADCRETCRRLAGAGRNSQLTRDTMHAPGQLREARRPTPGPALYVPGYTVSTDVVKRTHSPHPSPAARLERPSLDRSGRCPSP